MKMKQIYISFLISFILNYLLLKSRELLEAFKNPLFPLYIDFGILNETIV